MSSQYNLLRRRLWFAAMFTVVLLSADHVVTGQEKEFPKWWNDRVSAQLDLADSNSNELASALQRTPEEHRKAMSFLISNMNPKDLQTATGNLLLNNIRLAYEAKTKLPWGDEIPEDIFLNDVLPHFNVDETRELWRPKLYELCLPIVADCKTSAEAAQKLNEELFKKVGVKYSTARKRANQCPSESIDQGLASCTGLSVLLTDACRSVCVPARLSGIPSWPNKRGNHTWVEVWDGEWHFTGAAEPSAQGLNHTWFQNDAALADKSSRLHSVYSVSFKKTDTIFPLVWSSDPENPVYAVNVTDRYADPEKIAAMKAQQNIVQTMIRVWNADQTERIAVQVVVKGLDDETSLSGQSRDNEADMNDMLTFELKPNSHYDLHACGGDHSTNVRFRTGEKKQQIVEVLLREERVSTGEMKNLVKQSAADFFAANKEQRKQWKFAENVAEAYRANPRSYHKAILEAFKISSLGQSRKDDFENNRVTFNEHTSPYTVKEVGTRPENGWPLFIAMHGGGGAPARVNDSQWEHMQIYYKDQPGVTGYKYLALRAPNNSWNGFYDNYVYPLIENLIRQFIVHGDIDPDKVFIMGYSHGGYGAFAIGPKIPYRFAAVHSSAAAPTDGETSAKTLRNTRFTFMVGENDNAHGRRQRCEAFAKQIAELKGDRDDIYPVEFLFKPGFGHRGLPDRDMISEMYDYTRNVVPKHLTWELTDPVVDRFFWLQVDEPAKGKEVNATIENNLIEIQAENVDQLLVYFDERLIDPKQPVKIRIGEKTIEAEYRPSIEVLCRTLAESGDLNLAFDGIVEIKP